MSIIVISLAAEWNEMNQRLHNVLNFQSAANRNKFISILCERVSLFPDKYKMKIFIEMFSTVLEALIQNK